MTTPKLTPEETLEKLQKKTQGTRIQVLRFLSMIGGILAGIGAADITGITHLLPDDAQGWVVTIGLFAMAAKQAVMWIGDLIDNGKQDGSFKIGLWLMIGATLTFSISSIGCGNVSPPVVTPQGCFLSVSEYEGRLYGVGYCLDNRFVVQWSDDLGGTYRLYRDDDNDYEFFRVLADGSEVPLGPKEPIPDPPPVEELMEAQQPA